MDLCAGLRVLELPGSVAASFCGKLLAGVGAHVLKAEPPGGEPRRAVPTLFASVNTGKSSRVVEPGCDALDELVASVDLVLVSRDDLGADAFSASTSIERWTTANPALVVTHVSPFGLTGPRARWASSDLVQLAMSLWLQATGRPEREPLAVGGRLAEMVPGLCAASASLMAIRERRASGLGQIVDISQQEALLLCQPYFDVAHGYSGLERPRNGMPFPMTIVPASDGYLGVNVLTQTQWELLCAYTGHVDLLNDPRLATPPERAPHAAELTEIFARWARDKARVEVFIDGQGWRIPFGYVPHVDEIASIDQHRARSFFTRVDDPQVGVVHHAGLPFLVDGHRDPVSPVPSLGEERPPPPRSAWPAPSDVRATLDGGPLSGVHIVDLSMFWSGPLAADLFAQYGADVVKVESVQRVDGWRGLSAAAGIESSNLFNGVNLNKTGITLDLTSARGLELLRPLVEEADALIENFSPRVMGNFGLTDDVLHEWNPRLVILSMPAFGLSGPWREFVGFAPTIEQLSGLPELTGYPDGPPALSGNSLADPCAGLAGCFALLATLHSGRVGAHIDLSQLEALTSLLAPDLTEQQATGAPRLRHGDASRSFAPQGCYPTNQPDTWIVFGAPDDTSWAGLAATAGVGWADDPRFAEPASRLANADVLDELLAGWTLEHDNVELADALQAVGVPAAPVLRPSQLPTDEHLAARSSYQEMARAHVPRTRYPVLPFKFSRTPGAVHRPGPTLGQDNDAVLGGRLGLSANELAELRAARVIGEHVDD